jgi:ABC-type multidrug transport system ATPase subunit
MPPAIEVADLCKSYGDVQAVRGISFTVDAGEIVAWFVGALAVAAVRFRWEPNRK